MAVVGGRCLSCSTNCWFACVLFGCVHQTQMWMCLSCCTTCWFAFVFTRLRVWRCLSCSTTCWFACVLRVWRCLSCSTTCWFACVLLSCVHQTQGVKVFILLYNLLICFCVHQTQDVKMFILLYNLLICLCSPDSRCKGVYLAVQGDWGSTEYQEYLQQTGAHEQAWKHQGKHLAA